MRTGIVATMLSICATVVLADGADESDKAKVARERRERILRSSGGFVSRPEKGKTLRIVNVGEAAPKGAIEDVLVGVNTGLRFQSEMKPGEKGKTYMPDEGAAIVVEVTNADDPLTISVAPEQGWARVNVAALRKDSPSDAVLRARVTKEIWRSIVYMLGGGHTQAPVCVMKPVVSLSDIDNLKSLIPTPEPFRIMGEQAGKLGVARERVTTYRKACLEGWAAAPTNQYQKAVWDEIHKLPGSPIVIRPDKKK